MNLTERLSETTADEALDVFIDWAGEQGFDLYPAQEEAVLALADDAHVILSTPTGSGKSLVAVAAHTLALGRGQRSWYTAPVKALVSEKFFALVETFGAENVGMLTGDAAVNADAPIICATAEVLANQALREREQADVGLVVMDEFHFYSEPDRGWAWQVPLLLLPNTQFLLMSATLGDTTFFEEDLTKRTGRETVAVTGATRPVPLEFDWVLTNTHETIELLLREDKAPVYVVSFAQADAVSQAQALTSIDLIGPSQKAAIKDAIGGFRFGKGFGQTLRRLVLAGIGVHHAGMLPKYRRLVETLAQAGLLAVISGTDTLGVGINVPIRTVLLTSLTKYDGHKQRLLRAREFHQIAGRAGRAGFDTIGYVVVVAPPHVVENAKAIAKAGDDPKKLRRISRKKPPEGELSYNEESFDKLVAAEPEALTSRMRISHAMVLNVLERPAGEQDALHTLLLENHSRPQDQERLVTRSVAVLDSLLRAEVVEPLEGPAEPWFLKSTDEASETTADSAGTQATSAGASTSATNQTDSQDQAGASQPEPELGALGAALASAGLDVSASGTSGAGHPATDNESPGSSADLDDAAVGFSGPGSLAAALSAAGITVPEQPKVEPDAGSADQRQQDPSATGDFGPASLEPLEEFVRETGTRYETGPFQVAVDLHDGFALNQPLSAFALAALELLDPESPEYALDVVSVIEATLDDPRPVLLAQQFEARGEAVAAMKADGLEYDERMAELEQISWPKPLAEVLESALAMYRQRHPWVNPTDLSPKSVVRELYEQGMTFGEFVAHYKLARAEGVVLRYLSDAYRALRSTVPLTARTETVDDLIAWLGEVVRLTDSSLLDEWEALTDPDQTKDQAEPSSLEDRPLSAHKRALRVMVRQRMFRRVELFDLGRYAELAALDDGLSAADWEAAADAYFTEYEHLDTGPDARGPGLFLVTEEPGNWVLTQILADPEGDHDWRITAELNLAATDEAGEPVLTTKSVASV